MHSVLLGAAARHVTVDASSGDAGASSAPLWGSPVKEVSLPASDPLVLAVGGTTLTAPRDRRLHRRDRLGRDLESERPGIGGRSATCTPAPPIRMGSPGSQRPGACPTWPATLASRASRSSWPAVAGHRSSPPRAPAPPRRCGGTHGAGRPVRPSRPRLRQPRHLPHRPQLSYDKAFHDITTGNNDSAIVTVAGYQAAPGWDPVTGWGSPNAQVLVPLLARLTSRS